MLRSPRFFADWETPGLRWTWTRFASCSNSISSSILLLERRQRCKGICKSGQGRWETAHREAHRGLDLDVIRKFDLKALYVPDRQRIVLDKEQPEAKWRWNEAHDAVHSAVPHGLFAPTQ